MKEFALCEHLTLVLEVFVSAFLLLVLRDDVLLHGLLKLAWRLVETLFAKHIGVFSLLAENFLYIFLRF